MKKRFGKITSFVLSFAMAVALFWGMSLNAFADNNGNLGDIFYTNSSYGNANSYGWEADGNVFRFRIISVEPKEVSIECYTERKPTGELVIPEEVTSDKGIRYSITKITDDGFNGCDGLTQVTLPSTIKNIGSRAFQLCSNLESVNIPSGVTTIGDNAFHTTKISEITIPDSVTSIGKFCFYNAHSLQKVIMEGTTPPTAGADMFGGTHDFLEIIVKDSSKHNYQQAENWSYYTDRIVSYPWKELQYAFDASTGDAENPASAYTTIELTKDITAETDDAGLVIAKGKKIRLDLCGYKLDRGLTEGKENGYVIKVESGAKLIITDSSTEKTGIITGGYNTSFDYCGGGVCVEGYLELQDGSITGNKAYKGGGVAAIGQAVPNLEFFAIRGGSVCNNEAVKSGDSTGLGGGVYAAPTTGFNMNGGTVANNKAAADGGGVYTYAGDISNGSIEGNHADGNGGGVFTARGELKFSSGHVKNNTADGKGGGIYLGDGSNYSFVGFHMSTVEGCSAQNGGVYTASNARFETGGGSYIKNCIATENGGAVYMQISPHRCSLFVLNGSSILLHRCSHFV